MQFYFYSEVSSVWLHMYVQHMVECAQPGFAFMSLHGLFMIENFC